MADKKRFPLAFLYIREALGKHRKDLIALSIMGTFLAVFDAAIPFIVGGFLDAVIDSSKRLVIFSLELPVWMWFIIAFAIAQFIASILGWAHEIRTRIIGTILHADYIHRATSRLMLVPINFHKEEKSGIIWDKITRASAQAVNIIERVILRISPQILSVFAGILIAININVPLTLIVIGGIGLYILVLLKIVPPLVEFQKKGQSAWNRAFQQAYRSLSNVETVKQFTAEEYENKRVFDKYFKKAVPMWNRVEGVWSKIAFYQRVVVVLTQIAVFIVSVYFISRGELTVGGLVAFNGYTAMVFGPFMMLGYNWEIIQNGLVAIERSEKLLQTPTEKYQAENKELDGREIKGEIEFQKVSFKYKKGDPIVLENLSFKINSGEVIALVGESGVGKSTIVDLISRYYSPTKGKILIDGEDIEKISLSKLRRSIAVVPQEVVLFNDTIEHNIKYGNLDAGEGEVKRVAREAHADVFINKFPKKYSQLVGERGIKLSVGQKQRVAIARAMLRDPKILILDEPTSALDVQTEKYIEESFQKLMKDRTTIVVAHRLSTVRNADKIFVFDKGRVVEQGKHSELIKIKNGVYRKFYDLHIGLE